MTETAPPVPESRPETPLAIERLALAVENLRVDVQAQGSLNNLKLTTVLDAIARFDQTLKLLTQEMQALKRGQLDHEERLARLEAHSFREARPVKKKRGARRAAKKR